MQTQSFQGSGEPAWLIAHSNACFGLGTDPRRALGRAAVRAASTGRTHDRTRPMLHQRKKLLSIRRRPHMTQSGRFCCDARPLPAILPRSMGPEWRNSYSPAWAANVSMTAIFGNDSTVDHTALSDTPGCCTRARPFPERCVTACGHSERNFLLKQNPQVESVHPRSPTLQSCAYGQRYFGQVHRGGCSSRCRHVLERYLSFYRLLDWREHRRNDQGY